MGDRGFPCDRHDFASPRVVLKAMKQIPWLILVRQSSKSVKSFLVARSWDLIFPHCGLANMPTLTSKDVAVAQAELLFLSRVKCHLGNIVELELIPLNIRIAKIRGLARR